MKWSELAIIKNLISVKLKYILIAIGLLILIAAFLSIWPIKLIQGIVDLAIYSEESNVNIILIMGVVYLSAQVIMAFLRAAIIYLTSHVQFTVGTVLQSKLYSLLLRTKLEVLEKNNSVEIVNTIIEDTDFIIHNFLEPYARVTFSVVSFVIGLYFMLTINWMLTLMIIPLGLITSLISRSIGIKSSINANKKRKTSQKLWKVFSEGIRGVIPIRIHRVEGDYLAEVSNSSIKYREVGLSQAKINSISYFMASSLYMITIGAILTISAVFVVRGYVTIGGLTAIAMYNHMLVDPLLDILNIQQNIIKLKVSLKRVGRLFDNPTVPINTFLQQKVDCISLRNVSFGYVGEEKIIKNASLDIKGPINIAIVGETGSGKTTLTNIIAGLYQVNSGSVEYFFHNKIVKGIPRISYLVQDGYLFDKSVKENIYMLNPTLSEFQYNRIVESCMLYDVIERHRDTSIGEGGSLLSGGERKRVRLARALAIKDADIYIFDELSSSLDKNMSSKIIDNILNELKEKIVLFIEHNMEIANLMTKTFTVVDGQIMKD